MLNLLAAYVAGAILGPLLLPWLPGRSFSVKGAVAGLMVFAALFFGGPGFDGPGGDHWIHVVAWLCLTLAVSSYMTMYYTGSSTYTSLSGVKKEMRVAVPVQAVLAGVGGLLWLCGQFI